MTINVKRDFELVILEISGRMDSKTAPNAEKIISELSEDIKELVFDMSGVEYISSAGIGVLVGAYRKMISNKGTMRIENADETVSEVFEIAGLSLMLEQE